MGRGSPRRFAARVPAGRYRAEFTSSTTDRVVQVIVPPGEGPVELPAIPLESLAWVRMLGQPAAEIEAIDLNGKPVKLADHRGKVVVLMFWGTWYEPWPAMLERLADLRKRLRGEPLVLLALHDASITSLEAYHRAIVPFLDRYAKQAEAPFRLLLDRPPIGKGIGPYHRQAGEPGSGRTTDAYEVTRPVTFVIGKDGRLSFALTEDDRGFESFRIGKDGGLDEVSGGDQMGGYPVRFYDAGAFAGRSLLTALEDLLGLPRVPWPKMKVDSVKRRTSPER